MVVVFWAGIELFVNPMSDDDSLPIVAGRSEVVGVCAFIKVKDVNSPPMNVAMAIMIENTIKLELFNTI